MSLLDSVRYRLRVFTRSRQHEQELAEEMEFFVNAEARQREHAARGDVSAKAARDGARRRFGNATYYREEARRISGLDVIDTLGQDAAFALRTFARTPVFTAVAVATLAIGIGANTAIFSAVDTLLLTPLPFKAPDRLMNVALTVPATSASRARDDLVWSYPKVEAFRESQNVFSDLTAWFSTQNTVRVGDDALRLSGEFVDSHYFATLGIVPALGRAMLPTENRVGGPAVVVISDELWRAGFNADPSVIGKRIDVDIATLTIIGVAPPGFAGVSGKAKLWLPFLSDPPVWDNALFRDPYNHSFFVIGRLAPGVTPDRAAAISRELGPRIDARFPETGPHSRHWGIAARTLDATRIRDDDRRTLFLLFSAVGMVLLVACANVANLFLVRAAGRRREIAVRLAIGASRARLIRQLLVESVLLAIAGGVASLAVAWVGVGIISEVRPGLWSSQSDSGVGTVFTDQIHLNIAAFAFTAAIALATGLVFGLVPAMQSTRPELTESLKTETGVASRSAISRRLSMRDAITAFEIALAVVLLAGSGVLVRSLVQLVAIRPGFDPQRVLTMRVNRAAAWSRDSISRFYDVAVDRLRSLPGVKEVAIADCSPQSGGCSVENVDVLDRATGPQRIGTGLHWITPSWTDVLHVPLVRGRSIERSDAIGAPLVVVVSQSAAREFWPSDDAIGKRLILHAHDTARVVGVVGDVRFYGVQQPPRPDIYISYYQFPMSFRMMVHMLTAGDPAVVAEPARRALREVAPGFPVYDVASMETRIGSVLAGSRFLAQLLSLFAVLALVLATIGTYGTISYAVAQRTREMGVRIALGATPRDLTRLVVGRGLVLAAAGGAVGLVGASAAVRLIRAQLYGVEPTDPVTLVGIVVLLAIAVVAASWVPARRAAGIPAVEALRGG
ncbi:MAG TPA: ABC transporter permease [Gemmatimonadaceae bacterium]|nr:ABC transporter permease [Gemmatimonadaceae bacterium]